MAEFFGPYFPANHFGGAYWGGSGGGAVLAPCGMILSSGADLFIQPVLEVEAPPVGRASGGAYYARPRRRPIPAPRAAPVLVPFGLVLAGGGGLAISAHGLARGGMTLATGGSLQIGVAAIDEGVAADNAFWLLAA